MITTEPTHEQPPSVGQQVVDIFTAVRNECRRVDEALNDMMDAEAVTKRTLGPFIDALLSDPHNTDIAPVGLLTVDLGELPKATEQIGRQALLSGLLSAGRYRYMRAQEQLILELTGGRPLTISRLSDDPKAVMRRYPFQSDLTPEIQGSVTAVDLESQRLWIETGGEDGQRVVYIFGSDGRTGPKVKLDFAEPLPQ